MVSCSHSARSVCEWGSGGREAATRRAPQAHDRTVGSSRASAVLSIDPDVLRETSGGRRRRPELNPAVPISHTSYPAAVSAAAGHFVVGSRSAPSYFQVTQIFGSRANRGHRTRLVPGLGCHPQSVTATQSIRPQRSPNPKAEMPQAVAVLGLSVPCRLSYVAIHAAYPTQKNKRIRSTVIS